MTPRTASKERLSERERETLIELDAACLNYLNVTGEDWVRPMDCGASNSSHHSATLSKLSKTGLVQFKQRGGEEPPPGENGKKIWRGRGSKVYRITPAGRRAIAEGDGALRAHKEPSDVTETPRTEFNKEN